MPDAIVPSSKESSSAPEAASPAPVSSEPVSAKADATPINISFAGDCTLGTDPSFGYANSFPSRLASAGNDYSYFFRDVRSVFEYDDLTLVNLETTLTTASKPAAKKFRFKGDPSYVNILKAGSIEAVNIANNHSHDYLDPGFKDTVETLESSGIIYSGWDKTAYCSIKGVTIAMIGYTAWDQKLRVKLVESLKKARDRANIVIVSMHWGVERVNLPGKDQVSLGHFCIDNGADIVIGHHPHVIQGIERYKGGIIAYSLGNFCFGGNSNPPDKDSFILKCRFDVREGRVINTESDIIPCSISSLAAVNDYQPILLEGEKKDSVLLRLAEYSKGLTFPG